MSDSTSDPSKPKSTPETPSDSAKEAAASSSAADKTSAPDKASAVESASERIEDAAESIKDTATSMWEQGKAENAGAGGPLQNVSQDSKNLALLTWVGTIFFGFIPGLVLYLTKKDDAYVQDQSKEALNWSITLMFGYLVAFILSFIIIGVLLFPVLGIAHLIFCLLGVVATQKGETFRVPWALRLIH